jgi:hypothetical protein
MTYAHADAHTYVVAGPVLALKVDAGVGGFLTVLLLCLASAALFVFLSGSLKRMRRNVERGEFGAAAPPRRGRRMGLGRGRGRLQDAPPPPSDERAQVRLPSQGRSGDGAAG